jgi:hypothetical protein
MHQTSARRRAAARSLIIIVTALAGVVAAEGRASACACGCNIFDVGGVCLLPNDQGGRVYLEYDFQDQHQNWYHGAASSGLNNPDKNIETSFITAGFQYMFNSDWGIQLEIPYDYRRFVTTGGATGTEIVPNYWGAFGDVRVKGIFDGFFDDHWLGVTFGFKLPTGDYTYNDAYNDVDRDSEIGTGSIDVLAGYFVHKSVTDWCSVLFTGQLDAPVMGRNGYYPGLEFDAGAGVYFNWSMVENVTVMPILQALESFRMSDSGQASANPVQSGFERIFAAPGVEVDVYSFSFYVEADVPLYIHTTGNQLTAPVLIKAMVGFKF